MRVLVGCYLGISMLTLAAVVLLRNNTAIVTPAVWVRGTIVVATPGSRPSSPSGRPVAPRWVYPAAARLSHHGGGRRAILALPGAFPLWFKIEQGICGLLLLGVV